MERKVKLRENLRYFDGEDADFNITAGEEQFLPDRVMKAYSIKYYLYNGLLILTQGTCIFPFKESLICIDSADQDHLYGMEHGKFFKKQIDIKVLTWITKKDLSPEVLFLLTGELPEEPVEEPGEEQVEEPVEGSEWSKEYRGQTAKEAEVKVEETIEVEKSKKQKTKKKK
jgi:hypothetical protein